MHKIKLNSFALNFSIIPKSPLLIKSGGISTNPSLPDMQFVRTNIAGKGETIYIPGSSLKGMFRSFSENVVRSIKPDSVCDIFDKDKKNCSGKLEEEEKSERIYKDSCHICKVFGNQKLKGRISIADAHPDGDIKTEKRQGVAISRQTQAVAAGPFDMEIAVAGEFKTRLIIENFECWQIGIIAMVINALKTGWLKIGFGKNRGFGEVDVEINGIDFIFTKHPGFVNAKNEVWGIGRFLKEEEGSKYGLKSDDFCGLNRLESPSVEEEVTFIKRSYSPSVWDIISKEFITTLENTLK